MRVGQASKALGGALNAGEREEVAALLSPPLLRLFLSMGPLGQRHGYDVYRTLRAWGHQDRDLLAAGLLHDVGKGRLGLPSRTIWVLGASFPGLRRRLADHALWSALFGLRESLHHPEYGALAVARAGASPTVARLIRQHKDPASSDLLLRALQEADDDN